MHQLFHVQKPYRGFSCQPISKHLMHRIRNISYHDNEQISPAELRYLRIPYFDFNGETRTGEMICNHSIAMPLLEIFHSLYEQRYPIERIQLVDDFQADDDLCCLKNNTSCFNYRTISGTNILSRHAFGMAVDVNPFFNPYVTYINTVKDNTGITTSAADTATSNTTTHIVSADTIKPNINTVSADTTTHIRISPPGSEAYADRERDFPHKLGPGDLCYELFIAHGFSWGGDWTHCKDYQHFELNV